MPTRKRIQTQQQQVEAGKLVDANALLDAIFSRESRPSMRWIREQTRNKAIPYIRVGRLVFFDPDQVREALAKNNTVKHVLS